MSELSIAINTSDKQTATDLTLVSKKFSKAYYIGGAIILVGSATMILFGSYDYLRRKISYVNLLVRIVGIALFYLLIVTISESKTVLDK